MKNKGQEEIWLKVDKSIFIIIAVLGIGLFVLPSTLSMFAGQHSWYNPDPNVEGIPCEKCHVLEQNELMGTDGPHSLTYSTLVNTSANYSGNAGDNGSTVFWGGDDIKSRCFGCHQVGANFSAGSEYASYNTNWSTARNQSHAAIVIQCIDCHPWVAHELENSAEAHTPFYVSLNETGTITNGTALLEGANEACIACHTRVGVNITWNRASYLSFNSTVNTSSGVYNVTYNSTDTQVINTSTTTNLTYN